MFASRDVKLELVDGALGFKIPDLDGWSDGSTEPVPVGRESQRVDELISVESVEVLAFVQVPEHGSSIFATRSAERTIGRNSNGRNEASVSNVVGLQTAVGEVPDLDDTVPATGDDGGVADGGGEADSRDPVTVAFIDDGVLALSKGVPQLDGAVARSRDNLAIVSGEGNGKNVLGVGGESTSSLTTEKRLLAEVEYSC